MAKTVWMELIIDKIKDEYPDLTKEKIEGILHVYCKAVMENFHEVANDLFYSIGKLNGNEDEHILRTSLMEERHASFLH